MALFTVAEARAHRVGGATPLENAGKYPDADITAAAVRIKSRFETISLVALESTSTTELLDGTGTDELFLTSIPVQSVTSIEVDGVTVTLANVVDYSSGKLVRTAGSWPLGNLNIEVDYTHGPSSVLPEVKDAALDQAVVELVGTDIPSEATAQTDDFGKTEYAVPDGRRRFYRNSDVNAVLVEIRDRHRRPIR